MTLSTDDKLKFIESIKFDPLGIKIKQSETCLKSFGFQINNDLPWDIQNWNAMMAEIILAVGLAFFIYFLQDRQTKKLTTTFNKRQRKSYSEILEYVLVIKGELDFIKEIVVATANNTYTGQPHIYLDSLKRIKEEKNKMDEIIDRATDVFDPEHERDYIRIIELSDLFLTSAESGDVNYWTNHSNLYKAAVAAIQDTNSILLTL